MITTYRQISRICMDGYDYERYYNANQPSSTLIGMCTDESFQDGINKNFIRQFMQLQKSDPRMIMSPTEVIHRTSKSVPLLQTSMEVHMMNATIALRPTLVKPPYSLCTIDGINYYPLQTVEYYLYKREIVTLWEFLRTLLVTYSASPVDYTLVYRQLVIAIEDPTSDWMIGQTILWRELMNAYKLANPIETEPGVKLLKFMVKYWISDVRETLSDELQMIDKMRPLIFATQLSIVDGGDLVRALVRQSVDGETDDDRQKRISSVLTILSTIKAQTNQARFLISYLTPPTIRPLGIITQLNSIYGNYGTDMYIDLLPVAV